MRLGICDYVIRKVLYGTYLLLLQFIFLKAWATHQNLLWRHLPNMLPAVEYVQGQKYDGHGRAE